MTTQRQEGTDMESMTEERSSTDESSSNDLGDLSELGAGGAVQRRGVRRRRALFAFLAVDVVVAAAIVMAVVERNETTAPSATNGVPGAAGDVSMPARVVLPDGCVLAEASVVTALAESVAVPGGGGVDNPFIARTDGAFDELVSARILGATTLGAIGLWGVTPDGAFVPLNDSATSVAASDAADAAADDAAAALRSDAAKLTSTCAKAATGG
jgi:hypothetical protein